MRERTAGLMKSLLIALVRVLLPSRGRHRAAPPPQPPVITQQLATPPRYPVQACRCERERILQRRRARWIATYGIDAELRRRDGQEVSA
ncbi:hypothetical protein QQM39_23960 [Streptomyces sp. DT2A-34]|uniref:hypothetical protein n=1 Tax=Streptomyces sp. DT2A-34 TaxID=3051182 RepID=UPI00265BCFD2|nr:hypothetical protein [Streptomyces sp. DT2A-34]MDO0913770.1 hypothetical protein [Streptomyces sp. DT2A-34]